MRRPMLQALAITLLAASAVALQPAPAHAASSAKVVIVVGQVGSVIPFYTTEANRLATTARKYTSNVTVIVPPSDTWANVKAAMQGATIVAYFGHGNGWPSPYSTVLNPNSMDGFGLDAPGGGLVYYGESYIRNEVRLAPNAVVLLGHLCYASGNYEGENPDGALSYGFQRVDNFASGFLAAGARAVIADAVDNSLSYYLASLFTTHLSVDAIWQNAPDRHGHMLTAASVRTPGTTNRMDTDYADYTGRHRSFAGSTGLSSDAVVATAYVPGAPPKLWTLDTGLTRLSPNGDGNRDSGSFSAQLSEPTTVRVSIRNSAGTTVANVGPFASTAAGVVVASWNGRNSAGTTVADGVYSWTATATDAAGAKTSFTGTFLVDRVKPVLTTAARGATYTRTLAQLTGGAPLAVSYTLSEGGYVAVAVRNSAGRIVRAFPSNTGSFRWEGETDNMRTVPNGRYTVTLTPYDHAGVRGAAASFTVDTVALVTRVYSRETIAYADGPVTDLAYDLSAPATVTTRVRNAAGTIVRSTPPRIVPSAGSGWEAEWNFRDASGNPMPAGHYTFEVSATANGQTSSGSYQIYLDRLSLTASATTATRGTYITVYYRSRATLTSPYVAASQPGLATTWTRLQLVSAGVYSARVYVRPGALGSLAMYGYGIDPWGRTHRTPLSIPLK